MAVTWESLVIVSPMVLSVFFLEVSDVRVLPVAVISILVRLECGSSLLSLLHLFGPGLILLTCLRVKCVLLMWSFRVCEVLLM